MSTTQLNYVPEMTLFSYERGKQLISLLLLIYVGITLDFGVILKPLEATSALVMSDFGLLAGLLTILFLSYSLIIHLKQFIETRPEPMTEQGPFFENNELNKNHTANLYFWTGSLCCILFVLI